MLSAETRDEMLVSQRLSPSGVENLEPVTPRLAGLGLNRIVANAR